MVSGKNLKVIAPHLLARTHLCLMGVDVRKILEASTPGWPAGSNYRPRQVALICYFLEGVGLAIKCRC